MFHHSCCPRDYRDSSGARKRAIARLGSYSPGLEATRVYDGDDRVNFVEITRTQERMFSFFRDGLPRCMHNFVYSTAVCTPLFLLDPRPHEEGTPSTSVFILLYDFSLSIILTWQGGMYIYIYESIYIIQQYSHTELALQLFRSVLATQLITPDTRTRTYRSSIFRILYMYRTQQHHNLVLRIPARTRMCKMPQ